jgi:proline racemase
MRWSKIITVVDCHAEGESGQVVVGGVPPIPGDTVFDKRRYLQNHADDLRRMILFEPRGSVHHNANLLVPSNDPRAQMGYIILESMEYPAMSGSNTICVGTVLLETGILPMSEPTTELVLESPAGLISVTCDCRDGKVERVRFVNQPAFCYHLDAIVNVPGVGDLVVDIAYGGMTYVMVDAAALGFVLEPLRGTRLVRAGPDHQACRCRADRRRPS